MPIFMDRHDVSEKVTAEIVAQLHQADLKIEKQFGCRGLTYWFDGKRKTAFCLIEAPDAKAIQKMHNKAHGQVPNKIIEVNKEIVESFLGRIENPVKSQNTDLNIIDDPAFRTLMVIDIKRSAFNRNETDQFKSQLDKFNAVVIKLLKEHDGSTVKQTKTNFLISFKSVSNAVHAASGIQFLFKKFKEEFKDNFIYLKVALSAGVPVTDKKSFFEDPIKLAERLCECIKGDIIVSSEVEELYNSENRIALNELKNMVSLSCQDENFLTLFMDFAESEWNNANLKVDDFSKPVRCSKSQLYRKLIALTGKSPNTFIRDYRLDKALQLLKSNFGNISQITFETGFSSPSYFSKCFQKRYGFMPSGYIPSNA
jgi:AraC-like DNA-binding protein